MVVEIEFRKFLRVACDNDLPLIPTNYDGDGWRQNGFPMSSQFECLKLVNEPRCILELSSTRGELKDDGLGEW